MKTNILLENRYEKTLAFLKKHIHNKESILDLGVENPFSQVMKKNGYNVANTAGENLDDDYLLYTDKKADVVTAFEIFEHLLAPYNLLKNLKINKLVASVPLKLWFASAYWSDTDKWDRHYHEFEPKQFEMLLERTGWKILDSEKWTSASWKNILGIRPILRHFYPRYYIVYCERVA